MNNNKGRKYKQQGPQQKPQTHSQGQRANHNTILKGRRNHTKTGTKGAQTTDNGKEAQRKMSNGTQAQTQPPIKKHQPPIKKTQNMKGR